MEISLFPQDIEMRKTNFGFTLIELMITVAIISILAAFALPAYGRYVERARRVQAITAISDMQMRLERWRADNPTYLVTNGAAGFGNFTTTDYYTIALSGASATGYTLTATGTGPQASDSKCATVSIVYLNGATTRGSGQDVCWK